ncbi:hypothetical protein RM532_05715 [Salinisphaera sp. W335]|uniref:Uncharacterized protein n=1 Tax=Spectribacter hydrogenoxidans TaxID=3075608 RepID=A0ABU3BZA7_9GAMM|nr:hypothetical protein [Salinisphaera sp. W335]MDT0634446.1 hypothetical protein [Salinisphaera sp. W335]
MIDVERIGRAAYTLVMAIKELNVGRAQHNVGVCYHPAIADVEAATLAYLFAVMAVSI